MTDAMPDIEVTRAELCAVACAQAWRGDGEVMASPFGTVPQIGARLARLTFEPDLVLTDGEAALVMANTPLGVGTGRAGARSADAVPAGVRRGVVGSAPHHDDGVAGRPLRQPEPQCHRRLGPAQGPADRRAGRTGQQPQPHHELLGPVPHDALVRRARRHGVRRRATTGPRRRARRPHGSTTSAWWCRTSACSTSTPPITPCASGRCTRAWSVDEVVAPPASSSSSPTPSRHPVPDARGARADPRGPRPRRLRDKEIPS